MNLLQLVWQSLAFKAIYRNQFGLTGIVAFLPIEFAKPHAFPWVSWSLSSVSRRLWGQAMAPKRKAWEMRLASRIEDSDGKTGLFNMHAVGAKDYSNPTHIFYVIFITVLPH